MKNWNQKYHDKLKWHSLSNQFMDMRNLELAWSRVRANHGCAGIDRMDIDTFEAHLEQNLLEIQRLLKEKKYSPQPVRRVFIPKADGRQRPLGIPTVRDRIVQQAVKNILEPIFEEGFLPCSYGYRPGKSAHQAVQKSREFMRRGYGWIVDADIEGFFDHVDHEILMDLVREKIADGRILDLIEAFLKSGVMMDGEYRESIEGTPQGGVISPLLANIYLHHFDRRMGEEGFIRVRYADDFLVFCRDEAQAKRALETARNILEKELHLRLHPDKTRIVCVSKWTDVEFLGFRFNSYRCSPRDRAIKKFRDSIKRETRRQQPKNVSMVIEKINPIISGWGRYYRIGTVKGCFETLDMWIRGRVRCFKAKRRSNHVLGRILPSTVLSQMGLISLASLIAQ
jgi:group II intron reverse transcriptase/maturase